MNLGLYLVEREGQLEKLRREIGLLQKIDFPVTVNARGDEFVLYSEDYSRAMDFKIEKRSQHLSSGSCGYDGGSTTDRIQIYPQFYFNLKYSGLVVPIYIKHDGFNEDKRVVVKSRVVTRGWGEFRSENGVRDENVDLEKVFDFFREKGVRKSLLDKLAMRIRQSDEF